MANLTRDAAHVVYGHMLLLSLIACSQCRPIVGADRLQAGAKPAALQSDRLQAGAKPEALQSDRLQAGAKLEALQSDRLHGVAENKEND
jgi:hypothetical protein